MIRRLRWYIAGLLFTATVINYVDRQVLSVVVPVLTKELGIGQIEYANIVQAFLVAYTLMQIGSGILVDRWGSRVSLAVFMVWWSAANALHALARNATQLGICRFLLGAGEPGNFMAAFKVISEWYPAREKAFVNGLVNAGAAFGAIVAAPLVAYLTVSYGWRAAFVITGGFGLFWLAGWLALYHVPEKHPRITPAEFALIQEARRQEEGAGLADRRIPRTHLVKYPQTWGLFLARLFSDPVWWFYLFWLPKYLAEERGFSLADIGMLAWAPYLSADIGAIVGGLLSGYLIRKGWGVLGARAATMAPFVVVMPLSLAIPATRSAAAALGIICLVTFCHMGWRTNLSTVTNDVYPRAVVGTVAGMLAFGSGLGGAAFTGVTGWVVERFSYRAIFVVMGFLHPAAYLVYRMLVRGPLRTRGQ